MNIAIPDTNGSTFQYIAVVKRHRKRPESFPTALELYSMLSFAAMFRKQKTYTGVVKARSIAILVFMSAC
jgi:predicted SAM-dependent methyltransferase